MSTATAPLTITQLSKSYHRQQPPVLDDISLSLNNGEIFGLVGLNGVGKTTLLKSILNLITPDSGAIHLFGHPASDPASHKHLAYLPEKFYPSKYLKGWEHLRLCCSYYGQTLDKDRATALSTALDLPPEKLTQQVRAYSKGMAQKLGLLGTLLIDAPLMILDEPMSGLDPRARIKLKAQLTRLKEEGKTIFFSSHILSDLEEVCDRISVLHDRHLLFTGTPAEFRQQHGGQTLEHTFLQAIESTECVPDAPQIAV